ncbi:hypothetical protein HOF92_07065 [bacterium]|jgi:cytochrome c peroxidase|nr:hypothetical protein [bacterium]
MTFLVASLFFYFLVFSPFLEAHEKLGTPDPYEIEYPDDQEPSDELVHLGKLLFFDTRLSKDRTVSCVSCHQPALGFGDGLGKRPGLSGSLLKRNSPHLYNLAWNFVFFWDGQSASLEEQVLAPIQDANEMNMNLDKLISRITLVPGYPGLFKKAFGDEGVSKQRIASSLASFVRSIQSTNSAFDRFLAGDSKAMTAEALQGKELFEGKAQCITCHDGPNFTDNSFHHLGIEDGDQGRGAVVKDSTLNGAFKTPGLRNTILTSPYMHDGSLGTLEEVLDFYNKGGGPSPAKSPLVRPLGLTRTEILSILAFLGSLTDPVEIDVPALPGEVEERDRIGIQQQ